MLIYITIFFILNVFIYSYFRLKRPSIIALTFKGISTLSLLVFAVIATYFSNENQLYGLIIITALAFSFAGDIFLDLKFIYPKHNVYYTRVGFYSFIVVQLIYIGYFLLNLELNLFEYSFIFAFSGIVVFTILTTENLMKINYGIFRSISAIYGFLISFTMFLSLWIGLKNNIFSVTVFGVGMILFIISDLILSQLYFGRKEKNWMICSNIIFYFLAQYLIVYSIAD